MPGRITGPPSHPVADVVIYRDPRRAIPYYAAADTDVARGNALVAALAAQADGDLIVMGPGTFDIGIQQITVDNCTLRGQGREQTTIDCQNASGTTPDLALTGATPVITDFYFLNSLSNGTYTYPVGSITSGAPTFAELRRLKIEGDSDALYYWSNAGSDLDAFDCHFRCKYDSVVNLGTGHSADTWRFWHCQFEGRGPFTGGTPATIINNVVTKSCRMEFYDCHFLSVGDANSTETYGLNCALINTSLVFVHNCTFQVSAGAGTISDIEIGANASTVTIQGGWGAGLNGYITTSNGEGNGTFNYESGAVDLRVLTFIVFPPTSDTTTGDGKFYWHVPASLTGYVLKTVHAEVVTAGVGGLTNIMVMRWTGFAWQDMLSTALTIDTAETGSDTALNAAVINTTQDNVVIDGMIRIDVDAIHSTTAAKGLIVTLEIGRE